MTKLAIGYVVVDDDSSIQQKAQRLEKYCQTQGKCSMFKIYWTSERDYVKPFKNMISYVNEQTAPISLVFWTSKDMPSGVAKELSKLRAKGCTLHFIKEGLILQ